MSSRLFVEVREKRGLAYMINAGGGSFRDAGVVNIQAGLDPSRLSEALKVITEELKKISETNVSAKELANAKSNISGRMTLSMEDSSAQAQWFARQFLFNKKIETCEQVIKNIKKVSIQDVKRVAKNIFDLKETRVAVIGPKDKEEIIKILKY